MAAPSSFKEITTSSINSLGIPEELVEVLTLFFERTNESVIGYHYKLSYTRTKQIYIKNKVLHDVTNLNQNNPITISIIAEGLKKAESFDPKKLKVNQLKLKLKQYLLNYIDKPTIVYSPPAILGEIMTMICLSKQYYNMSFYDFLDQIFFDRFHSNQTLNSINVNTRARLSSKKISLMSSIYDGKDNASYYAWLYSSYFGAKKIAQKCGGGNDYEYHHEDSDFVDFIKNKKLSDENRCFTWMDNYNKSISKQFFSEGNKLSTADIYLVKRGKSSEIKTLFEKKTLTNSNGKKMLNISDYLKIVTRLYRIKNMFAVSLKQIEIENPPFAVLNYVSAFASENKEDEDWFYREILYLQQLSKKESHFKRYLDKLITIEPFTYNTQRATQKFYFRYTIKSADKTTIKSLNYFLEMVAGRGSVLIKPLETSSQSGEGQISTQVFNELSNIPAYRSYFSRAYSNLIRSRISILNRFTSNNSIASGELRKVGILSLGQLTKVVNSLEVTGNTKTQNMKLKGDFMTTYAEYLIEKEIPSNLTAGIRRRYKLLNTSGNLTNRNITQFIGFLNDLEFLYFLTSNENIIKEYAKKKIIMSMHSAASGRGYLIVSSSRFTQGKLYLSKLQSAVTVKVGH